MTLHKFIRMNELEQVESVWNGVLIADRKNKDFFILLYQIDAFYVEVFYEKYTNALKKVKPFKRLNLLTPYLNKIDISDLLEVL